MGRYATKSNTELFAQAFAEYFGSKNPSEFSTIFGEKLHKVLISLEM